MKTFKRKLIKRKIKNLKKTTRKNIQKGKGKLEKSDYYHLTKAVYSNQNISDFNLYSKNRLIKMLETIGLGKNIEELNKQFDNLQTTSLNEVKKMFEEAFEENMKTADNDLVLKASYNSFIAKGLTKILQGFINYQIDDETITSELTKLITDTNNQLTDIEKEDQAKYNIFKNFVITMFNERYFSINGINFIRNYLHYNELPEIKYDFSKPPFVKTTINLTPSQINYNKFVKYIEKFKVTFTAFAESHYNIIIDTFKNIRNKYNEEVTKKAIENAVTESDSKYELVLKKGTKLYKGVSYKNKSRLEFSGENDKLLYWFAFDPLTTFNYTVPTETAGYIKQFCESEIGYVGEFVVKEDYKLLNLLHENILEYLSDLMKDDPDMLEVINKILYVKDNQIGRNSYYDEDIKFVKWLCKNNYNGYISKTDALNLHPELCLCNPIEKVDQSDITPVAELFHFCDKTHDDVNFITSFFRVFN